MRQLTTTWTKFDITKIDFLADSIEYMEKIISSYASFEASSTYVSFQVNAHQ